MQMLMYTMMNGQMIEFKGTVTDEFNQGIQGAAVVLYTHSDAIESYTITDQVGSFAVQGKALDANYLEITHLSFSKKRRDFSKEELRNKVVTANFILMEKVNALDEVIVLSEDVPKDTIDLDLDKLNLHEDNNLKDILEKIPNFRLGTNGSIIYNGKAIEKILVNKKESFVHQNSIALESIEKKIIENISVINNYHDSFILDFEENPESVLNIDTKNRFQYIVNGSVEGKYGFKDKYNFNGRGFLFSKTINAFLTTNTNTIGKTTMNSDEINKLFSEEQPFSNYMAQSLNSLFSSNENLKKDFFTGTNLTFRKQTQKLKIAGLIYQLAPNRTESLFTELSSLDKQPLLSSVVRTTSKSNSFLGAFSIHSKLSNKSILALNINASFIDSENSSKVKNKLFEPESTNTTVSNNVNNILSVQNKLSLASKLTDNLILNSDISWYDESSKLFNDYNLMGSQNLMFDRQDYSFSKDDFHGSLNLKYKVSDRFIPSVLIRHRKTREKINDRELDQTLIERSISDYSTIIEVNGDKVFKKLDYKLSIGLNSLYNTTLPSYDNHILFVPIIASLNYESRLNRIFFDFDRRAGFNSLESGIHTILPFNQIIMGNAQLPVGISSSNNLYFGYSYNNVFDAKLFSFSFSRNYSINGLKKTFLQQEDGISELEYFIAATAKDYTLSPFFSRTISQYKFPLKIDLGTEFRRSVYPINADNLKATTTTFSPSLKVRSITERQVNFDITSKLSYVNDVVGKSTYNSVYSNSSFSLLFKNKNWHSNITFLKDYNKINGTVFKRSNIDLNISHTIDKLVFSLEARHIGELLSLIENQAYNSQFIVRDGISSTLVSNESLNYLIFGIKYNF